MTDDPTRRATPVGKGGGRGYEIILAGHLDTHWSTWLDELTLTHGGDCTTTLRVVVSDQAELHGLLGRIRDLGVVLISVTPIADNQR